VARRIGQAAGGGCALISSGVDAEAGQRRDARDHIQLVLTTAPHTQGRDFGVVSVKKLAVADWGHKCPAAAGGLGNMPKPMINEDLKTRRLGH